MPLRPLTISGTFIIISDMNGTAGAYSDRRPPNPLRERTREELIRDVHNFYDRHKLKNDELRGVELKDVVDVDLLVKGALIARDSAAVETCGLTGPQKLAITSEPELGLFQQTKELKVIILTTACAAIIQGWQQSSINASSHGWQCDLLVSPDTTDDVVSSSWYYRYIASLTDAAPWISASIILGTAHCPSWQTLLACRLLLGVGIGAKASIAPVFAAEAAAEHLRGRLLMMWQLFDTFGIFVGFVCYWVFDRSWRGILGSAAVPALILLVLVFLCPESPRFLIRQGRYADAFLSLRQLRGTDIQAAKDLYYIHSQLQIETELFLGRRPEQWWERDLYQELVQRQNIFQRVGALFTVPRNRRACVAAFLVMAAQQLCGINVLSFYSSDIFRTATGTDGKRLDCSPRGDNEQVAWLNFGFGLANFLFTIPAYKFIDSRGRRILLLISLGGMFFTLLAISGFFRITGDDSARKGLIATFSIVIFTFFYGIGAGPVPFTFSAEVFPLAFREVGMSFSVMVNFLGLSLLILFVPALTQAFSPSDSDGKNLMGHSNLLFFFTGLNALAFVLVFFLVPSRTTGVPLEVMNHIFSQKTSQHAFSRLPGFIKRRYEEPASARQHPGGQHQDDEGDELETVNNSV
ncbi:predicted protein [Aspergillus terreus NIH2624]|uniref:Major facilitator superfamily (MFS) profile domain-containing protein n=1 Tax=Aspergillus terreus (strain NIH 2624 / FGSC A1156) TaxID=341663 RepID=Q0C856_ASPTN|nr:uncharacterized protein ATEG_10128 [Aspergillus terreus NIH2624]EAU29577.1 predicted protein [Aspergillus terreus NIH2624]